MSQFNLLEKLALIHNGKLNFPYISTAKWDVELVRTMGYFLLPMKCCSGQHIGLYTKTLLYWNVHKLEIVFMEAAKNHTYCHAK